MGGGSTGVELAGEIAALHSGKRLAIATASASLTPEGFRSKIGKKLASQLKKLGCSVYTNSKVDTGTLETGPIAPTWFALAGGGAVAADYLIICHGSTPNSDLMAAFDSSTVTPSGHIRVDLNWMRVAGHPTLFAVGDVADTADPKMAVATRSHAAIVSTNILSLLAGKHDSGLRPWTPALKAIRVSVGPHGGAGQLPLRWFNVVGARVARRVEGPDLFNGRFRAQFGH